MYYLFYLISFKLFFRVVRTIGKFLGLIEILYFGKIVWRVGVRHTREFNFALLGK